MRTIVRVIFYVLGICAILCGLITLALAPLAFAVALVTIVGGFVFIWGGSKVDDFVTEDNL